MMEASVTGPIIEAMYRASEDWLGGHADHLPEVTRFRHVTWSIGLARVPLMEFTCSRCHEQFTYELVCGDPTAPGAHLETRD